MDKTKVIMVAVAFIIAAMSVLAVGLLVSNKDSQEVENQPSESQESYEKPYAGLISKDLKEREQAAEAIRNEHTELIKRLIQLAAQKVERRFPDDPTSSYPWHDSKHLSILLLGDLRAVEAVPVLLENLEYKNPKTIVVWEQLGIGGGYPAAEALSKIGMPAVGPTIDKLGAYPPEARGNLVCSWILREILGVRLARLRLQIAIEETRDEAVRRNLSAALPYFKTDQEKAAEERARQKKDSG